MESLEILIKIRKIVRSINLESKKIQKDYGISIPQLLCLDRLRKSPSFQSTHGDLMQFLSLNSSTVTGIINRLENKGYVARLPREGDKRVTPVVITSRGVKLLDNIPNVLHEKLANYLESLPESKMKMIQQSLDMIISSMQIEELDASPMLTSDEPLLGKTAHSDDRAQDSAADLDG